MKIKPVLCMDGVPMDGRQHEGRRLPYTEILGFNHRTRRAVVIWDDSLVVVETKPNPRVDALLDVLVGDSDVEQA